MTRLTRCAADRRAGPGCTATLPGLRSQAGEAGDAQGGGGGKGLLSLLSLLSPVPS